MAMKIRSCQQHPCLSPKEPGGPVSRGRNGRDRESPFYVPDSPDPAAILPIALAISLRTPSAWDARPPRGSSVTVVPGSFSVYVVALESRMHWPQTLWRRENLFFFHPPRLQARRLTSFTAAWARDLSPPSCLRSRSLISRASIRFYTLYPAPPGSLKKSAPEKARRYHDPVLVSVGSYILRLGLPRTAFVPR